VTAAALETVRQSRQALEAAERALLQLAGGGSREGGVYRNRELLENDALRSDEAHNVRLDHSRATFLSSLPPAPTANGMGRWGSAAPSSVGVSSVRGADEQKRSSKRHVHTKTSAHAGVLVPLAQRLADYHAGLRQAAVLEEKKVLGLERVWRASQGVWARLDFRERLWAKSIRAVEGFFGSGIGDFFELWRDVVYLDSLACLLWLGLVILPFVLSPEGNFNARWTEENSVFTTPSAEPAAPDPSSYYEAASQAHARWRWMFYGDYARYAGNYDIGEAYTAATLGTFALLLLTTLRIMVNNLREHRDGEAPPDPPFNSNGSTAVAARPRGADGDLFICELYSAVDFNCTEPEAVRVGIRSAFFDMRERLYNESLSLERTGRTFGERLKLAMKHACGGCVSLLLVFAYLFLVVYACDKTSWLSTIPYGTVIFLSALKLAMPMAVRAVIALEGFSDEGEIVKQVCLRVYALKMTNIGIAIYGIHETLHSSDCPNTTTGQFMLQLYVTDLVFSIVAAALTAVIMYKFVSRGPLDFDISSPTIDLFYRQEMALLGVYTCPALLFVFVGGESVFFFVQIALLRRYYQRPARPFTLAQGENFMHSLSALTAAIGLAGSVWLMHYRPIGPCGPHGTHVPLALPLDNLRSEKQPLINLLADVVCSPFLYAALVLVLAARLAFKGATTERLHQEVAGLQDDLGAEKAFLRRIIDEHKIEID